jgi:hypothetical protein
MSNNSHGLDEEIVEQDEMKTKLDLITISTAKNLETMETEINTLQSGNLFTDGIKFTFNGAYALDGFNNLTGSLLSITNPLTSGFRRYVLVRTDTYSSDVTLSDSNTKFTISETGYYLSIMSYEIYDNSADTKTVELEFKGDTEGSLQMARNTVTGTSTNYEYERVTNTMIVYLTSGNLYSYQGKSNNGAVINAYNTVTNMTLLKISKAF